MSTGDLLRQVRAREAAERLNTTRVVGHRVRSVAAAVAAVAGVVLAGCDLGRPAVPGASHGPSAPAVSSPAAPVTSEGDAARILARVQSAGVGVTAGIVQDEDTDPNRLLGRPGGYVGRASFDLPGGATDARPGDVDRGGVIEVFPTVDAASRRARYIAGVVAAAPELAGEYDTQHGRVLLRITRSVGPGVAAVVAAVAV